MADRASRPRHLAEPSRRFGLSPLQQLFLVAMLSLAAISAVIALLTWLSRIGFMIVVGGAINAVVEPASSQGKAPGKRT